MGNNWPISQISAWKYFWCLYRQQFTSLCSVHCQAGCNWIASLANYNIHICYMPGKSKVEADALSGIDWEKCDETIQAESFQAVVAATIAGGLANIEAVSCNMQAVEPFLPIQSEPMAISKAITQSSNQSHPMHLEHGSSKVKKVVRTDHSNCPTARQLEDKLNPKCMTIQDWVEAQSKDKIIGEIVQLFKSKLCCHKISEGDNNKIKQFIRQCNRSFLRKGILCHKTEMTHPDRSTIWYYQKHLGSRHYKVDIIWVTSE